MLNSVLAGIVTYNPDIDRLIENVTATKKQTDSILIVDNGSTNYESFSRQLPPDVYYIRNENNAGIATALCQIMEYAQVNHYQWVLSLDQDSVIEPGLILEYLKYANREDLQNIAMFTCLIKDRNFVDEKYEEQTQDVMEVAYCITSAAFVNVEKYFCTQGYDVSFFIDAVDFDLCYSLREAGFLVARINFLGLYHEVGKGENRSFLGKRIVVYHHSAFRVYHAARNTILMYKKHKKLFPWYIMVKKEAALFARILLYEDQKNNKIKSFAKGLMDANTKKGQMK